MRFYFFSAPGHVVVGQALDSQACATPISRPHSPPPDRHWTSFRIDLIDDMQPPPSLSAGPADATFARQSLRMPSACLVSLGSYRIPDAMRLSSEQYVGVIGCLVVWGLIVVPWLERVWSSFGGPGTSSRAGGSGVGWGSDGGGRVRAVQRQPGREDELRESRRFGKAFSATMART